MMAALMLRHTPDVLDIRLGPEATDHAIRYSLHDGAEKSRHDPIWRSTGIPNDHMSRRGLC